METTVDITTKGAYSAADTAPSRGGLFARVSAGQSLRAVGEGCKKS